VRAPAQATAMKRKFMAADLNLDGRVDRAELMKTNLLDIDARWEDFDIVTKDGKAGLDAYEFSLLLSLHAHCAAGRRQHGRHAFHGGGA